MPILNILKLSGLYGLYQKIKLVIVSRLTHKLYLGHHWLFRKKCRFLMSFDPVRLASLQLAIETILRESIPGSFAELGVFRGHTSRFIHDCAPDRRFYLFDTFTGFPSRDLHGKQDLRFRDTHPEIVKKNVGDSKQLILRAGYFPDTSIGLEHEQFALVLLDADLFDPTLSGLSFFYPRLLPGGYLFIHDFNSDESEGAVRKAVGQFFRDKPEPIIEIPDEGGSIVIRKLYPQHADEPSARSKY